MAEPTYRLGFLSERETERPAFNWHSPAARREAERSLPERAAAREKDRTREMRLREKEGGRGRERTREGDAWGPPKGLLLSMRIVSGIWRFSFSRACAATASPHSSFIFACTRFLLLFFFLSFHYILLPTLEPNSASALIIRALVADQAG